jgi:hypothetical protein
MSIISHFPRWVDTMHTSGEMHPSDVRRVTSERSTAEPRILSTCKAQKGIKPSVCSHFLRTASVVSVQEGMRSSSAICVDVVCCLTFIGRGCFFLKCPVILLYVTGRMLSTHDNQMV